MFFCVQMRYLLSALVVVISFVPFYVGVVSETFSRRQIFVNDAVHELRQHDCKENLLLRTGCKNNKAGKP